MSGIFGIVGPRSKAHFSLMKKKIFHKKHALDEFSSGPLSVGRYHLKVFFPGKMPVFDKSKKLGIIVDGYIIFDNNIIDSQERSKQTALHLLDLYEKHGDGFLKFIKSGKFNLLIIDLEKNQIKIVNDRFGFHQLFYHFDEKTGAFLFAPETKAIVPYKKFEVDWTGVREFFDFGTLLCDRTYFKQVKLMNPATIMTYDFKKKRLTQMKYWDIKFNFDRKNGPEHFIECAYERMKKSCERLYSRKNKYALFLSGGIDSRTMLYFFAKPNVTSYTFDHSENGGEIKFARRVASALGVENRLIKTSPKNAFDEYKSTLAHIENYESLMANNMVSGTIRTAREGNNVAVIGYLGDAILGSTLYTPLRRDASAILDLFGRRKPVPIPLDPVILERLNPRDTFESQVKALLPPEFYEKVRNASKEMNADIINFFKPYRKSAKSWEELVEIFKIDSRGRRCVNNGGRITRCYLEEVSPFFDYDLFDFYLTIPLEVRSQYRLYYKLHAKKLKSISSIPIIHTEIPPKYPFFLQRFMRYFVSFTKKLAGRKLHLKSRGRLFKKDSYEDYDAWIRTPENSAFILKHLDASAVNKPFVEGLLESHQSYRASNTATIIKALSFSLWYYEYVRKGKAKK